MATKKLANTVKESKKVKKVLLISNHFYPYVGGLENFVLELGKGLVKKGVKVDILTYNYDKDKLKTSEKLFGMHIVRLPSKSILGKTYSLPIKNKLYKQIISELCGNKYSAVITNTRFFTISSLGAKIAKTLKKKYETQFIHIEHGNKKVTHNNFLVEICANIYDNIFGRKIMKQSDKVVCISRPGIAFVKKMGAKKTELIHNSIHTKEFAKITTDKKLRKELGISKDEFVVTYIGRLIYAKGVQDLIKSLKQLNMCLIIIGDGNYKKELIELASKEGVKTIFTGTQEKSDIKKYLAISNIFVNPSYSEGLPTSILEAGAAGLPIIATDVGGTREIISNDDEGLLIKPQDYESLGTKILELKKNASLRKKLGLNIKKKISKDFEWEKNIEKFYELL